MSSPNDTVMVDVGDTQFDHNYRIEGTDETEVLKARDKFLVRYSLAYFARGGGITKGEGGKFFCNVSRAKKC